MEPEFDRYRNHVGWILNREYIFDTNSKWVAFADRNNNVWSVAKFNWIGEINGLNLLDRDGMVVAWNPNSPLIGTIDDTDTAPIKPAFPPKPLIPTSLPNPLKPPKPPVPVGGWSKFTFNDWINQ